MRQASPAVQTQNSILWAFDPPRPSINQVSKRFTASSKVRKKVNSSFPFHLLLLPVLVRASTPGSNSMCDNGVPHAFPHFATFPLPSHPFFSLRKAQELSDFSVRTYPNLSRVVVNCKQSCLSSAPTIGFFAHIK